MQKRMNSLSISLMKRFFYWCILAYLAILPMSNTIALRNLILVVLLCLAVYSIGFRRDQNEVALLAALRQLPLALVAWVLFLCLFPLWAVQPEVAWHNLRGQWVESIFSWVIGFFAVVLLGRQGPGLWALAVASFFSIAVHLLLTLAAWLGVFGHAFPQDMTLATALAGLAGVLSLSSTTTLALQNFPWGFHGVEPMHGNLGYTASQAIILFGVCLYVAWRDQSKNGIFWGALGIAFCFLSVLIAGSRGAVLYGVGMLALIALISRFGLRGEGAINAGENKKVGRHVVGMAVFAVFAMVIFVAFQSVKKDARWHTMVDKVRLGVLVDDPVSFLCNGVTSEMEAQIHDRFAGHGSSYAQALIEGLKGQDGGRILLMRAGIDLVRDNPVGLDGSRDSYKKLIESKCGHPPALQFAHSHQGWVDAALALGWAGLAVFAGLFLYLMSAGWRNMGNARLRPWAFSLLLVSIFWILRGFADSVYREHYLQMQALLLSYLFFRMRLALDAPEEDQSREKR